MQVVAKAGFTVHIILQYILTRTEKKFKNEQRNRDAATKKKR